MRNVKNVKIYFQQINIESWIHFRVDIKIKKNAEK